MSKYLITGGTGSFGRTMVRELAKDWANEIVVFSRDEAKQDEMRTEFADRDVRFVIGDTRDKDSMRQAMRGVERVFHAAALKQVPSCEVYPMEAVKTNILGSSNVIEAAIEANVESVVVLSTDKAVYPVNAMGISKAMMERVAISYAEKQTSTRIMVTRYGNVMFSRGSVIPRFIEQLQQGNPITITDPEMTRFLMSLSQSVDLVNTAWQFGQSGDLFVRAAPAATILDLAEAVMLATNLETEIKVIGWRPGEKKHESLLSVEEHRKAALDLLYYRIGLNAADINNSDEGYTSQNTRRLDVAELTALLCSVKEIQPYLPK